MEQLSHLSTPNNVLYVRVLPNRETREKTQSPSLPATLFLLSCVGFSVNLFANRIWKEHLPRRISRRAVRLPEHYAIPFVRVSFSVAVFFSFPVSCRFLCIDLRLSHAGVKNFQFKFNFRAKWSKVWATRGIEPSKYHAQIKNPPLKGLPTESGMLSPGSW